MILNDDSRIVIIRDKPYSLSNKEYTLFKYLDDHKDHFVSEKELIEVLWNKVPKSRTVATVISRIRKKLGYSVILTKYDCGYTIDYEKCN